MDDSGAPKRGAVDGAACTADGRTPGRTWRLVRAEAPQWAHTRARGAAHSSQNLAPRRLSYWHCAHFIVSLAATPDWVAAESVAELVAGCHRRWQRRPSRLTSDHYFEAELERPIRLQASAGPITIKGFGELSSTALVEAFLQHEVCPVVALLEHEDHAPRELIAAPYEQARGADQHRDVGIVAAGVHHALHLRSELDR